VNQTKFERIRREPRKIQTDKAERNIIQTDMAKTKEENEAKANSEHNHGNQVLLFQL